MIDKVDMTKVMVGIAEAQAHLGGVEELEQKLDIAMKHMKDHWMVTNEDHRFRAAIGAVMEHYGTGTKEYKWLSFEIKQLSKAAALIQASQAGLVVDLEHSTLEEDKPEGYETIGLVKMWKEIQ